MRGVNAAVPTGPAEWREVGKLHAIDRQLELLSAVSASIRRLGGRPDTSLIDQLLDERLECQSREPTGRHSDDFIAHALPSPAPR